MDSQDACVCCTCSGRVKDRCRCRGTHHALHLPPSSLLCATRVVLWAPGQRLRHHLLQQAGQASGKPRQDHGYLASACEAGWKRTTLESRACCSACRWLAGRVRLDWSAARLAGCSWGETVESDRLSSVCQLASGVTCPAGRSSCYNAPLVRGGKGVQGFPA